MNRLRTGIFFVVNAIFVSALHASTHVPTPELAKELIGLQIRMTDTELFKSMADDPIEVEIEFSPEIKISRCEVVVRKGGVSIGTFTAPGKKQESALVEGKSFVGYSFRLAPSVLAESYLLISREDTKQQFYVPFLRFIPDRHIDEKVRKASPDFRDEASDLYTNVYQIPPEFLNIRTSDAEKDSEKGKVDPFKEEGDEVVTLAHRPTAQEILEAEGVTFPAGAGTFSGVGAQLVIRNTEDNMKLVERYLEKIKRR